MRFKSLNLEQFIPALQLAVGSNWPVRLHVHDVVMGSHFVAVLKFNGTLEADAEGATLVEFGQLGRL